MKLFWKKVSKAKGEIVDNCYKIKNKTGSLVVIENYLQKFLKKYLRICIVWIYKSRFTFNVEFWWFKKLIIL